MLSEMLITDIAEYIKDRISVAEVVFEGKEPEDVGIMRKEVKNDLLMVYVNTTKGTGTITDIRLKDDKGNVLISKPRERVKTTGYAIVSSFYIRVREDELTDPVSIFEMRGGING